MHVKFSCEAYLCCSCLQTKGVIVREDPTSGPTEGFIRFHNRVVYNGVAYIAGQTSTRSGTYAGQTREVSCLPESLPLSNSQAVLNGCRNIDVVLHAA